MIIQIKNKQRRIKKSVAEEILLQTAEVLSERIRIIKDLKTRNVVPVVSLLLTNDKKIRELNLEYRGKDSSTDVLSFPAIDSGGAVIGNFEDEIFYEYPDGHKELELGDIVISVQTAVKQAEEIGNSFESEFRFLFIHSFLHLLGYDHMNNSDEREMLAMQKYLTSFFRKENINDR